MLKVLGKILIAALFICLALLGSFVMLRFLNKPKNKDKITIGCCHNSYFSQPDFYNQAYLSASKEPIEKAQEKEIKGIIVNHHLLAPSFIAKAFNQIATAAPLTVILVSPDHFSAGKNFVTTSAYRWQTPFGVLEPDIGLIKNLNESVEENPFINEHGIKGITAFIKKSLPNAKVVPIIFNDRVSVEQAILKADKLYKILPPNCLIVGSFDFSHYLTNRAADFHDVSSLAVLQNLDVAGSYKLDIDSRSGLAFYLQLLKNEKAEKFTELDHSNSAKLVKQDTLENTSYITGYFSLGKPNHSEVKTILILPPVKDTILVNKSLNRSSKTWSVEYLERLFSGQDKTALYYSGQKDYFLRNFKNANSFDLLDPNKTTSIFSGRIKLRLLNHGSPDYLTITGTELTINFSHWFLSDDVLKNGGTSIAYGISESDSELNITILPIGVKNGIAKLLTGQESAKILTELAGNSIVNQEIKQQIKEGKINLKK